MYSSLWYDQLAPQERSVTDAVQGMDSMSAHCHQLLHVLALDVQQELEEAYPEELSRTPLRKMMFQRPNVKARCRARKLMVHKYVHLTPMQRYERAQAHSELLPRALRLADFLVLGSMLDLSKTSVDVRSPCANASVLFQYLLLVFKIH